MTISTWLNRLTQHPARILKKSPTSSLRQGRDRCRPSVERLEDRTLLAYDLGSAFALGSTGSDSASSVATDAAANLIVTGTFKSPSIDLDHGPGEYLLTNAGAFDGFAAKYDPSGNLLWGIHLASPSNNNAWDAAVDGADNVLIIGSFSGSLKIGAPGQPHVTLTNSGISESFLAKIDSAGNVLWATTFGAAAQPRVATAITTDAAGNVYASGRQGYGLFVAKYSTDGAATWTKVVSDGTGKIYSTGETSLAHAEDIAVDANQNVYLTGPYRGKIDFNPDPKKTNALTSIGSRHPTLDIFVLKLNASGIFVWSGSMGGQLDDGSGAIALDGTGNIYISGGYGGGANDFDPGQGVLNLSEGPGYFLVKLDPNRNLVWGRSGVGGPNMALDAAGNIYTTGVFSGTFDADPGPGTFNLTAGGAGDMLVSKLNSSGIFVWAADILTGGADSNAVSMGITVDGLGNIYTSGDFRGTMDFDPAPETYSLTATPDSNGNLFSDAFVSKLIPASSTTMSTATVDEALMYYLAEDYVASKKRK